MTRRRSSRSRRRIRLYGAERLLFILGATLYVVGVFGGLNFLAMASFTSILLLMVGGGLLLLTLLLLLM